MLAKDKKEFKILTMPLNSKKSSHSDDLELRIAKLEKEVDAMKQKKNIVNKTSGHRILRMWGSAALILTSALFFVFSISGYWLKTNLVNTDVWVEKTTAIIQDENVRQDIASGITNTIFTNFDVKQYVEDNLPDKAKVLAGPITDNVKNFTEQQINKLLQSQAFIDFWQKANQTAHKSLIESLNKADSNSQANGNLLYFNDDKLILNLQPVYANLQSRIASRGLDFVNKVLPDQVNKQVTVGQAKNMPEILLAFKIINKAGLLLLIPMLIFGILGLVVANDKRRALILFAISTIVLLVLNVQTLYLAKYPFIKELTDALVSANSDSATAIFSIYTKDLIFMDRVAIVMMLIIILFALLAGPSKLAVAIRNQISSLFNGRKDSKVLSWISLHNNLIIITSTVVAFGLILFPIVKGPWYPILIIILTGVVCLFALSIKSSFNPKKNTKNKK